MLLPTTCPICGRAGSAPCGGCVDELVAVGACVPPSGLDSLTALVRWDEASRRLVAGLKYRNARAAVDWLVAQLAVVAPHQPDVVTWLPTTLVRRRQRGFDQAELLARRLGRRLRRPTRSLLVRDAGPAQTGAPAALRQEGPRLRVRRPVPDRVLVVDDVCTTGSSLRRAALALRAAGATAVDGLVVARVD